MTIKEFVQDLLSQGLTDAEIEEALLKGEESKGITPKKPPFNRLLLIRIKKQLKQLGKKQ